MSEETIVPVEMPYERFANDAVVEYFTSVAHAMAHTARLDPIS